MTTRRIDLVRSAVLQLADTGVKSVEIVRSSFDSGEAPFQTVGSGSTSNYLSSLSQDPLASALVKGTARFGLQTAPGGTVVPPPKPELDSVAIVEDRDRGVIDQFTVELTFSLSDNELARATRIKVFRANLGRANVPRAGINALIDAPTLGGKNTDIILPNAIRAAELGVGNKLTSFVADDPNAPQRVVIAPDEHRLNEVLPPRNTNRNTQSATGLISIEGADPSVLENLQFYVNRRSSMSIEAPPEPPLIPGRFSGVNILRGSSVAGPGSVVQTSNAMDFKMIGSIQIDSTTARRVGQAIEFKHVDPSVVYGAKYAYYVACVGPNGELGPRSRLVHTVISRTVPPKPPEVLYGLTGGVPRFTIRASRGTSHVEVFRAGRGASVASVMGSDDSLIIQRPSTKVGEFYHAGDLGLGSDGSTCFIDRDVIAGDKVTYRIYTVDAYGLKCQTPFTCTISVPGDGDRVPLPIPSITSEQTNVGQPSVRVSVSVDDPRIVGFVFSRRDVTVNERAVHQANQPEYFRFGCSDAKRAVSRRGPSPLDQDWPSVVMAQQGSASFTDNSVRVDRVYQYAVSAIDRRGNKSPLGGAPPVGVYSKPTIDAPSAFGARVEVDNSVPRGVLLTWSPGTVDFSPNHLLDDQDVLAATAVRSVFQVERRQKGAPFWDAMPATSNSYFFDPAIDGNAPPFRPPYVVKGLEYEYRVLAMQSGGFISPRTDALSVTVAPPPPAPSTLWVRSSGIAVRPLNVVLSWNMDGTFISRWEIQRAVTNKMFGARVNSMDSARARSLNYQPIAGVTPEASRAAGLAADLDSTRDKTIFVGRRFFVDGDVSPANSYFYRVRSVGKLGESSEWVYAGISLVDHAFDRKMLSALSDDERVSLTDDSRPISERLKVP